MRGRLLPLGLVAFLACSGGALAPEPDGTVLESTVARLEVVGGDGQPIWSGRRSPEPFQVRALDGAGRPVAGARVHFALEGQAGGILSQPQALTDAAGQAETYLLDARSGFAALHASSGEARALFALRVERAPGAIEFEEATGAVGLPGLAHPDEHVRARVLDTEGRPLPGAEVWFVGPERLSTYVDTSDAAGWASTRIVQSEMRAGDGDVFAFILAFPEVTTRTSRPVRAAAERVVLVSIDGLRADALERYRPPTLLALAAAGASTTLARTVLPALTTPAHLSLLSGVGPEVHGIWGDNLFFTPQMTSLDPLFRNAGREGFQAHGFLSQGGPLVRFEDAFECRLAFGLDSLTFVEPDAGLLAGAALPTLLDGATDLVFVHIPDPDLAGHAHGWSSPEYGAAVLRADSALARIAAAVGEETLLIVVSDHGGGGDYGSHLHGSAAEADVRIPIILSGSRVARAELGEASILDVPATALWALGLRVPNQYQGRVLLQAFR